MLTILAFVAVITAGTYLLIDRLFFFKKRTLKSNFIYIVEVVLTLALVLLMVQWFNFEFALAMAVIISGAIYLLDVVLFSKLRSKRTNQIMSERGDTLSDAEKEYLNTIPTLIDFSRSFFGVLLLVLIIRSMIFSPFRIPSGSLKPTMLVGDFLVVNKFKYGIRLPVVGKTIIPISEPDRGDIVVVRWPPSEKFDYIKRVIGLPGDKIQYIDKTLYINGEKASQRLEKEFNYTTGGGRTVPAKQLIEDLGGIKHGIYIIPGRQSIDYDDITVPEGMYFIMGDNRDDSQDSRYWGFVTEDQLLGKAEYIVFSWDSLKSEFRKDRFFKKIH